MIARASILSLEKIRFSITDTFLDCARLLSWVESDTFPSAFMPTQSHRTFACMDELHKLPDVFNL